MIYGYARVSTRLQEKNGNGLEYQREELIKAGADPELIYYESFSGTQKRRPEHDRLLSTVKDGDTVIVLKIDRIARNTKDGIELIDALTEKGCRLHILNMGMFDNTPTGKLMRNIMLAFAEWERDQIVERTQSGKEIARQKSGYREGRPPKYSEAQLEYALKLLNEQSYTKTSQITGISRATLVRAKKRLSNEI